MNDIKLFVKKTTLFLALILLSGFLLNLSWPDNDYWGNKEYLGKIHFLSRGNYNTVFFGSSRILTGMNPMVFDSIAATSHSQAANSFNMATAGTWANENFYLYEKFINDDSLSAGVDVVLMECQNIMAIQPDKITTSKALYYQSVDHLRFLYHYAVDEVNLSIGKVPSALYTLFSHGMAYGISKVSFSRFNIHNRPTEPSAMDLLDSRGFLPLKVSRMKNVSLVTRRLNQYRKSMTFLEKPLGKVNQTYLSKMTDMIEKSKEKGVRLIFVLPPVLVTPGLAEVFNRLPAENKIEACKPQRLPALYDQGYWAEETHLTETGSVLLTSYFAHQYNILK
jgi:hypothetical protein